MTKPSPAQQTARDRNWRIFRLRALFYQVALLSPDRSREARHLVDEELMAIGAEPESIRRRRLYDELTTRLKEETKCQTPS